VEGDFATWISLQRELLRRQFSTQTTVVLASSPTIEYWGNDVDMYGNVSYIAEDRATYSLEFFDGASTRTLQSESAYTLDATQTDSGRVVYRRSDVCCLTNSSSDIMLHDGLSEIRLATFRSPDTHRTPSAGTDYQIAGEWIAFTDLGGLTQRHVWTRDQNGLLSQRTQFGSDSVIEALNGAGEVMLQNGRTRYLSTADGGISEINSSIGRSKFLDGNWYVLMGRSVSRAK